MSANPYVPIPATLVEVKTETPTIKTFVVEPEAPIPFQAGQFIEMSVPGYGEAPFTPSSTPSSGGRLELTVVRVGRLTAVLHGLGPGAQLGIRGPLGRPYPLDRFRGREVLIVGGGCGLAPLRSLLFALLEDSDQYGRIILRYGARDPSEIVYRESLTNAWGPDKGVDVLVTVDRGDDSWAGRIGVVTTILASDCLTCSPDSGVAVVCGPPIMMRFATHALLELGYPPTSIFLSMEKNMSCGIGKCGHCRLGRYYACKDGPVFVYDEISDLDNIWD